MYIEHDEYCCCPDCKEPRIMSTDVTTWTTVWPKEKGYYWFYGWTNVPDRNTFPPILQVMRVEKLKRYAKGESACLYLLDGVVLTKAICYAQFLPISEPIELPELN